MKLNGIELKLSDRAKWLGIMLDSKLSWLHNIKASAFKGSVALYMCRKAIDKSWKLNPTYNHTYQIPINDVGYVLIVDITSKKIATNSKIMPMHPPWDYLSTFHITCS